MFNINNQKVDGLLISKNNDNTLSVSVSIKPIKENTIKEVRITTKDIIAYLMNDKNIDVGECLKSSVVTNTSDSSRFGTWIFKMKEDIDQNDLKMISPFNILPSNILPKDISNIENTLTYIETVSIETDVKPTKKRKKKDE